VLQSLHQGKYKKPRHQAAIAVSRWRTLITARAQLVAPRIDLGNQIRGVLKPFGLLTGRGVGKTFVDKA
jgi:transposase